MKTQFGDLITGDLKEKTLTFEIEGDFVIKAGKYAIVPMEEYKKITNVQVVKTKDIKIFEEKEGYINRHISGLPKHRCDIEIIQTDVCGDNTLTCRWHPFNPEDYTQENMPSKGYLGTAKVSLPRVEIGLHAWEQNNDEFIYYKILS